MEAPALVYRGDPQPMDRIAPREVRGVDSVGAWFTSSREAARLYGKEISAYPQPGINLAEFDVSADSQAQDIQRVIGANVGVAEQVGLQKQADALRANGLPDSKRLHELTEKLEIEGDLLTPAEEAEYRRLRAADKASIELLRSPAYMAAWRTMMEGFGHDGIVWRNSTWDYPGERDPNRPKAPHDVYLIFNRAEILAIAPLSNSPTPNKQNSSDGRYYIGTGALGCFYTLRYTFEEPLGRDEIATRDYHLCNLSTDRDEAIAKAKDRTGFDLSASFDLSPIHRRKDIDWSVFQFGKFTGHSIHQIREQDPKYLVWVAENMSETGKNGQTISLIRSLMAHELNDRQAAREAFAAREQAIKLARSEQLSDVVSRLGDGAGGFRDSVAQSLKLGEEPSDKAKNIVCEILGRQKGRRGSKAYVEEHDRVAALLEGVFQETADTPAITTPDSDIGDIYQTVGADHDATREDPEQATVAELPPRQSVRM